MSDPHASISMPQSAAASTQATPLEGDAGRPRVFPCESCGADLTFHINVQSLKCDHCGHVKALTFEPQAKVAEQDFQAMIARLAELRDGGRRDEHGLRQVQCGDCGATVRFAGTLTSTQCAYCGAALQLEDVHDAGHRVPVDGVLSFRIERDTAQDRLGAWVRSRWFAPRAFTQHGAAGRFNGVYLPYWTYDTLTTSNYSGQRGEHYYVTVGSGKNQRSECRTRWYPASGTFQRFFDDILVVAATGVPAQRLQSLEPWPLNNCAPFNPELLAGFLARTYDVDLDAGFDQARALIDQAIEAECLQRIGGDTQRLDSVHSRYDAVTYKHLLLPVWMLAYRYAGKTYQVVVNATTAEVQGDRPYSWIKITLTVLAGLTAAAGLALWASRG